MRRLKPFPVHPGERSTYRAALAAALDGTGPALAPYAATAPAPPAREVADDIALVGGTSGSTGMPKRALLGTAALLASADATHERLGGPGQWLLPMPAQHIAGTQVLIRSLRAGLAPVALDSFHTDQFVAATGILTGERRYTSLVPTQLRRLLDAGPAARAALARYDGILLGGAAAPPRLLADAAHAGVSVFTTYGMSETCGGCVYNGRPLSGTTADLDQDGRIILCGNTIASGYLDAPELTAEVFGTVADGRRTFRTDDVGQWRDGRLRVLGRLDDLINTGGLKVAPRVVEEAAAALPDVIEAVALGLPDDAWGQTVAVALRTRNPLTLHEVREACRGTLPAYALPRRLLLVDQLPLRGPGKPDRAALARMPGWQTFPAQR